MTHPRASTFQLHVVTGAHGKRALREGVAPPTPSPESRPKVPSRIAKLIGLAHHVERVVRSERLTNFAEAAAVGRTTRGRMSQIQNLRLLAPDIQEELLFLDRPPRGREPIGERDMRPIAIEPDWQVQREMFAALKRRRMPVG